MKEKLQQIINGEIKSNDAVMILRLAIEKYSSLTSRSLELGELIGQAEDIFIYGKEGRPRSRTFR